ncbi:MAG: acyl-CoA thioesterase [Xanthobacteraceae bacterium]
MTFVVNRRQVTVEWGHCDPAGFLFLGRIFEYFDMSSWLLFQAALGVAPQNLGAVFDIVGIPLVGAQAHIVTPVAFGEAVEILSNVSEFRRSSFDVQHRLLRAGELAIEGSETRVWAAADKDDPSKLKSRAIPPAVIERFKSA